MQQPRIIIVDSSGATALPYSRLVARLQPLEVRVETSLEAALATLSRDSWDLGVVTARSGPTGVGARWARGTRAGGPRGLGGRAGRVSD